MSVIPLPILRGASVARTQLLQRRRPDAAPLSDADQALIRRLFGESLDAETAVRRIIQEVRRDGDTALHRFSQEIDGAAPQTFAVSEQEFAAAREAVDADIVRALQTAAERVRAFHEQQLQHATQSFEADGVGQMVRPLALVGLYVPGTAAVYPSTVLHTAIPAAVAGVPEICIVSPAGPDGAIAPVKLLAAEIAGVTSVYKLGGAQAIAALAYGTESIPRVDKICGPGGRFVTLAKRLVYGDVGIDAIYGPTESVIVADDSADPDLVSADLLAQAEHDPLAAPLLITSSAELARTVARIVPEQAASLERGAIALQAFANRGGIVLVENLESALDLANTFAPEHLALVVRDAERLVASVHNAGGVFVGESSPEALADYVAGPSHVMPTGGSARFASPLNVGEFLKITTVVRASEAQLQEWAPVAETIARAEGLTAHARSLQRRRRDC